MNKNRFSTKSLCQAVHEEGCQRKRDAISNQAFETMEKGKKWENISCRLLGVLLAGAVITEPVYADEQEGEYVDSALIEEVIVTAQKREQSITDIPMSVSVLTGDILRDQGAATLKDIQYAIPSLQVTEQGSDGSSRITLRGISPPGSGLPTVGQYLNEVPVNTEVSGFGLTVPYFDIERIEVLRGPQGTLYGEGSVGGTVRTLTRMPTSDGLDGEVNISGTEVDEGGLGYKLSAASNLPLNSDQFAARVAGYYEEKAGYIDSPRFGDDINEIDRWAVRTSFVWTPAETVEVSLVYQHLESEGNGNNFSDKNYQTNLFIANPSSSDEYDFANLVVVVDFGFMEFTSSTGWIDRETDRTPDLTTLFTRIGNTVPGAGAFATLGDVINFTTNESESYHQEFRFSGEAEGGAFWQLGASYRDSESFTTINTQAQIDPFGLNAIGLLGGPSKLSRDSWAIYVDYAYPLAEDWEFNIGARHYEDTRSTDSAITTFGSLAPFNDSVDNKKLTGRISLKWEYSEDHNAYISAAQGFRSGGLQFTPVPGVDNGFGPEELTAYELGFKGSFPRQALTYDLTLFFNDYDDIQVFVPNIFQLQAFGNAGSAEMQGFDLSISWAPIDNLALTASYGYNDHEYKDPGVTHNAGDPIDFVSESTSSFSADYSWNLTGDLQGHVRADYQRADAYQNSEGIAVSFSDSLDIVNLRIGVKSDGWNAYLVAENLSKEDGVIFPVRANDAEPVVNHPRSIGLAVQVQF